MALNEHQARAASAPEARVAIVAGAGTGKTETIVRRTIGLCQLFGRVRLCGFTRASAQAIRERVERLAPGLSVEATTIHALAADICRRHLCRLPEYRAGFTLIDEVEEDQIKAEAKAGKRSVERTLEDNALLRFDDLLRLALRVATEAPDAFAEERGGAIVVDEAQDLSRSQWALIRSLAPDSFTAIGDPAQAIYEWNGGVGWVLADRARAAAEMPDLFGDAAWYHLPTNYRSRQGILDLANRIKIPGLVQLTAARGGGGGSREVSASSDILLRAATGWVVGGPDASSWAILSRTRRRAQHLLAYLKDRKVPVHAPGLGTSVWATEPARQLLDAFHALLHPHGSLHVERVLRRAGMSESALARAHAARSGLDGASLWNWACTHLPSDGAPYRALYLLSEARESLMGSAHEAAQALSTLGIAPHAPADSIPADWSVPQMMTIIADPNRRDEQPAGTTYVGTIHSAKGLEWPNVAILGLEEGTFPSPRSEIVEERRLWYVALTRAKEQLVFLRSTSRGQQPSRFLDEIREQSPAEEGATR